MQGPRASRIAVATPFPMSHAGRDGGRRDPELVGQGPALTALRREVARLAVLDVPVLVQGETGAGKELVARALHRESPRSRGAFVAVNCGAIPAELVEAELFGCAAGAFTGARRREGHVARAHRGVLFLDEVGDLPPAAQVVLLRVLETGEVQPVGDSHPVAVDFRLVSATHRDLRAMVRQGTFRADLYHRLAAFPLLVPPLRDRPEDLPLLAPALVPAARLTEAALERLRAHPWPGNVRELRNTLLRAVVEAEGAPVEPRHLRLEEPSAEAHAGPSTERPLRHLVAECVAAAYRRHGFNVRATARALDVSPTTIYRHLALLGEAARP